MPACGARGIFEKVYEVLVVCLDCGSTCGDKVKSLSVEGEYEFGNRMVFELIATIGAHYVMPVRASCHTALALKEKSKKDK